MSPEGRPAIACDGPGICKELRSQDTSASYYLIGAPVGDVPGADPGPPAVLGRFIVPEHPLCLDRMPNQPAKGLVGSSLTNLVEDEPVTLPPTAKEGVVAG